MFVGYNRTRLRVLSTTTSKLRVKITTANHFIV